MSFTTFLIALLGVGYALGDGHCDGIDPQKRMDCGYLGIQRKECVDVRRCCWDDTVQGPGVPWCFKTKMDKGGRCDGIDPQKREDCGYLGIQRQECQDVRRCCWDDTVEGVPWCFKTKIDKKCDGIRPEDRRDCGYFGIQRDECEKDRGCCFDDKVANVPWCFVGRLRAPTQGPTEGSGVEPSEVMTEEPSEQPMGDKKCDGIPPGDRRDCGYFGIQRDECEKDRGCCFDDKVANVPWCFVGRLRAPTQGPTEGSGVEPSEVMTEVTSEQPMGV